MSEIEWADLASENQRLRERVAELEEHVRKGDQFIGAVERAEKAEAALSRSRNVVAEERHLADVRGEMLTKAEAERDAALAQIAVLREALGALLAACGDLSHVAQPALGVARLKLAWTEFDADFGKKAVAGFDLWVSAVHAARAVLASTPAPTRAEAEAWLRAGEPVRGALAVPAEHDYSGLCAAPSCEGHCGYVHARGCEAVREYLADHGGEPYRAPSKEATRD